MVRTKAIPVAPEATLSVLIPRFPAFRPVTFNPLGNAIPTAVSSFFCAAVNVLLYIKEEAGTTNLLSPRSCKIIPDPLPTFAGMLLANFIFLIGVPPVITRVFVEGVTVKDGSEDVAVIAPLEGFIVQLIAISPPPRCLRLRVIFFERVERFIVLLELREYFFISSKA